MIKFTTHCMTRLHDRKMQTAWVRQAIADSDLTVHDSDPSLTQSFKTIADAGDRVLKAVHRAEGNHVIVVTTHVDERQAMMKTTYDPEADAYYARFAPDCVPVETTIEVAPGVMVDLDAVGDMIGIEVLSVKVRAAGHYGTSSRVAAT